MRNFLAFGNDYVVLGNTGDFVRSKLYSRLRRIISLSVFIESKAN